MNRLQANNGLIFRSAISGLASPDYSVFEVRPEAEPEYLARLLRTTLYKTHFRRVATGLGTGSAGFLRVYDDDLLETVVFLPPKAEQKSLLSIVDERLVTIDIGIKRQHTEIDLLAEYRTRLIADVVTGKLDVREAAAQLPDKPEEPEPLDEADTLTDAEEVAADDLDAVPEEVEA